MTYENIRKLVRLCRKIQEVDDADVFFAVSGRKSSGKSSFGIQFSKDYVQDYFGENCFNIRKYFCYNNKQVDEKIHTLPKYAPIIGDEAIRFAWSREWNKAENKDLVKFSTQVREKHHILFLNIPKIVWIDKAYREGLVSLWAWIHSTIENGTKKSYAIVFEPDENQGQTDSWHLKKFINEGKEYRIGRSTDIEKIYKLVRNHPCFMDIFQFPKVPDDIYKEYQELKVFYAMEKGQEYTDQRQMGKVMSYNLMRNWDDFQKSISQGRFTRPTYRIIADMLTREPDSKKPLVQHTTIRNWVHEMASKIPNKQEIQKLLDEEPKEEIEDDIQPGI